MAAACGRLTCSDPRSKERSVCMFCEFIGGIMYLWLVQEESGAASPVSFTGISNLKAGLTPLNASLFAITPR